MLGVITLTFSVVKYYCHVSAINLADEATVSENNFQLKVKKCDSKDQTYSWCFTLLVISFLSFLGGENYLGLSFKVLTPNSRL